VGVSSATDFNYDPLTSGSGAGGDSTGPYTLNVARSPGDDTLATALPLAFDGNQLALASGAIAEPNQVDLYQIRLSAGDTVSAGVAAYSPSNLLQSYLRAFDGNGTQLALSNTFSLNGPIDPHLLFTAPAAGRYYLGVSSEYNVLYNPLVPSDGSFNDGSFTGTYTLSVARSPAHGTLASALPLAFDGNQQAQAQGIAAAPDQVDLYKSLANFGDEITVEVKTPPNALSPLDSALRVFDDAGRQLAVGPSAPGAPLTFTAPTAGAYYVGVSGAGNIDYDPLTFGSGSGGTSTGTYTLNVARSPSTETGSNDSLATADVINGNADLRATLGDGGHDYFRLTVGETGALAVTVTPSDETALLPRLTLYGDSGQLLIESDAEATGSAPARLAQQLQPGTYYLEVSAAAEAGGGDRGYVLGSTFDPSVPPLSFPGFAVGSDPSAVAAGDFTHDGTLDLVVANAGDNTVSVLLGRGDGTFLPAVNYALPFVSNVVGIGNSPAAVAVGDFNGDGNLDIAVAVNANQIDPVTGTYDSAVSILLGLGDGKFLPAVNYPVTGVGSMAGYPVVAYGPVDAIGVGDFNGDGNLDLVTNNSDNTVSVLLGNGDGTFGGPNVFGGSQGGGAAVGDFNHDGFLDLATIDSPDLPPADEQGTLGVLLGGGGGLQSTAAALTEGNPGFYGSVAVGDFDHDGNLDLVTVANNDSRAFPNTLTVWRGQGDGTFLPVHTYQLGTGLTPTVGLAVGDFYGDGNLDVIVTNPGDNTVSVLRGNGDLTFQPPVIYAVGSEPSAVVAGDFNQDGNLGLATTDSGDNTVTVLLGAGQGEFQTATPQNGIAIRDVPILHDFDGDSLPDSVTLSATGELLFRKGLPGGPDLFAPPVVINPGQPARDVTAFRTAAGWEVAAVDTAGNRVSLYAWSPATDSFQPAGTVATGNLPVRVAAADLTGDGLDDLVVANDFDHSVSIAFQTPSGQFTAPLTYAVGVGPSDIAFAGGGPNGPDVVVSDQVSGDYTVLFNDAAHSFSQQSRYRAGTGPFDIAVDPNSGEQTVVSELQTVALATGDFTGPGQSDLVLVNLGDESFSLLPAQGPGRFATPQLADTYLTSNRPGQAVSLTLPGDSLASVAVLMEDLGQVWIYRNNGDGTFAAPTVVDAGNDPSGFSVATVNGQLALLVGNAYGDILTLLYDGHGGFAPDRANLQGAPLAVGTIKGTGQQYAVVADQKLDQVWLYSLIPGTTRIGPPVPIGASQQLPLLAPGAVQTFSVPGDPNPYLAVANSLSNDVLLYQYDPATGQFNLVHSYNVGDDPVSITVGDINGDGIPDLAVANQGSNDISLLIGSIDPSTRQWVATPYQRLSSGGSGPNGVSFVEQPGSTQGPDLLATNNDGTLALVPGIGSGGKGSGFFAIPSTRSVTLPGTPLGPVSDGLLGTTQGIFRVNTSTLATALAFASTALTTFGVGANGDMVAGFSGGTVELLAPDSDGQLVPDLLFRDARLTDPNALQLVTNDGQTDIFATNAGEGSLFVFALSEGIAVPGIRSPLEPRGQSPEVQSVSEAGLFLVAVFVTDAGVGGPTDEGAVAQGGFGGDAGPLARGDLAVALAVMLVGGGGGGAGDDAAEPGPPGGVRPVEPGAAVNDFIMGVDDSLRSIREQIREKRRAEGADDAEKAGPGPAEPQGALDRIFRAPEGALPPLAPGVPPSLPATGQAGPWPGAAVPAEVVRPVASPDEPGEFGRGGLPGAPECLPAAERATDAAFALPPPAGYEASSLLLALALLGSVAAPWSQVRPEGYEANRNEREAEDVPPADK